MTWIQTSSGRRVDLAYPHADQIDIEDIAHALSHLCRFTGHSSGLYSVADHSISVSYLVPPEYAMQGLLHDATEAYLGDVSAPLKRLPEMAGYRQLEATMWHVIANKFDLPYELHESVHKADIQALMVEKAVFFEHDLDWGITVHATPPGAVHFRSSPALTKAAFLRRYRELATVPSLA